MRGAAALLSVAVLLSSGSAALAAGRQNLPQGLSESERTYLRDHFEDYLKKKLSVPGAGRVPTGIKAAPAEFDRCEGVIFAYTQYTSLVRELVKETAMDARAFVVVSDESDESSVRRTLESDGVNMSNVTFRHADIDSVWMRDYGPWWIQTEDGDREIIDLIYNRPRPNDDRFPSAFAVAERLKAHTTKLILPGGNLILDGKGCAIMTDMVFDQSQGGNPQMSMEQLQKYMKELFGVHKVIVLKAMKRDGTGHVDMFAKLLNETTFIVGEYATPGDGAADNYAILNENAAKLANEANGEGKPFKVFRIPMPKYNGRSYTHTNSLIVNDKVLVPTYNRGTDEAALNVYRTLMPGAKVVGFDCNQIIGANGAIHCITKLCMADPLVVTHEPAKGEEGTPIAIRATVESEQPIEPAKVQVFWRVGGSTEFTAAPMQADEGGAFTAALPAQIAGTRIEYYLRAEDVRGMHETSPEDAGPSTVHALTVQKAARAD